MSAHAWIRRRNKQAWNAKHRSCVCVIDLADVRARAERRDFNAALSWWLDHPGITYQGIHNPFPAENP